MLVFCVFVSFARHVNTLYTGLKDLISKEHAYLLTKIRLLTNNVLSLKPLLNQLQSYMYIMLCLEDSSLQVFPVVGGRGGGG